ncbi:hypothetical protein KCG45_13255 [Erythrobacter sp. WH131]|uniref:Uncharacterized protein n=1 Tax=Erythrobacter ani TaxID=2827235 RepID=A0ABS6SQ49_9SPHN|nr:hypothetical protein [Erythrobacter ani]
MATTDGEAAALLSAIDPGDFADLELGAKIVGPRGPEVKTSLSNEVGILADITSFVACPAGMETCDPNTAPEGTIYTYVHIVYPGEDMDPTTGAGAGTDDIDIESAAAFMMTAPAHGFTGEAGFSKAEAVAAAGSSINIVVTCEEDGQIYWTANAGDGGDQWEDAEPITFYWRSTLPPAGPAVSYAIRANGASASGEGPYPAKDDNATNACTAIPTAG